jgi:hypothetical protein
MIISIAIGGACALGIGNTIHAAIERYLASLRSAQRSREAGERIRARLAAGEEV